MIHVPYDEGKALILCKQRHFVPGCLYIWTKNKQYDQILEHYILENDFESIMRTCEEYGDEAPFLWFEAFKYTVDKPELGDKLPAILSQLEARNLASPLVVLKFLSSVDAKKCHTFGSIKVGDDALARFNPSALRVRLHLQTTPKSRPEVGRQTTAVLRLCCRLVCSQPTGSFSGAQSNLALLLGGGEGLLSLFVRLLTTRRYVAVAHILRYLKSSKAEIDAKQAEMQRLREETLRNREVVRQSKTRQVSLTPIVHCVSRRRNWRQFVLQLLGVSVLVKIVLWTFVDCQQKQLQTVDFQILEDFYKNLLMIQSVN
ncbi:unnamed protein product [Mesocestoides corti]|uniref:Uncharacterized protein n=1 Tax=Mesocestoides corti TaxID=53468 RepID=A0A0R3UQS2_MESCO|nr:unnamed protein product [Mesocestoides corti]